MSKVVFSIKKGLSSTDFRSIKDLMTVIGAEFNWDSKQWELTSTSAEKKYLSVLGTFAPMLSWKLSGAISRGDIIVDEGAEFITRKPYSSEAFPQVSSLIFISETAPKAEEEATETSEETDTFLDILTPHTVHYAVDGDSVLYWGSNDGSDEFGPITNCDSDEEFEEWVSSDSLAARFNEIVYLKYRETSEDDYVVKTLSDINAHLQKKGIK